MTSNHAAAWLRAQIAAALPELGQRIYPDAAPEGTPNPCLIYQSIETAHEERLDHGAAAHTLVAYQLRAYASTRKQANAIRDTLRVALSNVEPTTQEGWRLESTGWGNGDDTYDPALGDYGATAIVEIFGS